MSKLKDKQWWMAAGTRVIKTVAQTALAVIGTGLIGILDVDWVTIASVALMAGVASLLTSLAGLPEVSADEKTE